MNPIEFLIQQRERITGPGLANALGDRLYNLVIGESHNLRTDTGNLHRGLAEKEVVQTQNGWRYSFGSTEVLGGPTEQPERESIRKFIDWYEEVLKAEGEVRQKRKEYRAEVKAERKAGREKRRGEFYAKVFERQAAQLARQYARLIGHKVSPLSKEAEALERRHKLAEQNLERQKLRVGEFTKAFAAKRRQRFYAMGRISGASRRLRKLL